MTLGVIREYKLFLEEAGIYVDTIRGPYGGYILRKSVNVPPLLFNTRDIEILKEGINNINDSKLKSDLKNIENKMSHSVLDSENKNKQFIDSDNELKVYNALNKAIKYDYKVKIKYYNNMANQLEPYIHLECIYFKTNDGAHHIGRKKMI